MGGVSDGQSLLRDRGWGWTVTRVRGWVRAMGGSGQGRTEPRVTAVPPPYRKRRCPFKSAVPSPKMAPARSARSGNAHAREGVPGLAPPLPPRRRSRPRGHGRRARDGPGRTERGQRYGQARRERGQGCRYGDRVRESDDRAAGTGTGPEVPGQGRSRARESSESGSAASSPAGMCGRVPGALQKVAVEARGRDGTRGLCSPRRAGTSP